MSFSNFPPDFVSRVLQDEFLEGAKLLDALEQKVPVSIRFNPSKKRPVLFSIDNPIAWCSEAYYLDERPQYTLDPLFHAGVYYPQEAGSMFLETVLHALNLPENPRVLDLCAAPGGKSTLIASYLNGNGLLVSNEVIQSRAKILKENVMKWGVPNSLVTNNDPADFERVKNYFDLVVVDAPCSGEGMFRKDKDARNEWSVSNVTLCAARQKRIVMDVWSALKAGGYLIYSTCTFNSSENEDNIQWFLQELDAEIVTIQSDAMPRGRNGIGHYGLPSKTATEGFYIAVLRKKGETDAVKMNYKSKGDVTRIKDVDQFTTFCKVENQAFYQWKEFIFSFSEEYIEDMVYLHASLKTIKLGTEIGEFVRKGWNPKEGLALNPAILQREGIQTIELTLNEALAYLHGDTYSLKGEHGYCLMTYQNEPLGWIKHLGNRFNNLYPKDWRIRMRIDTNKG